MAEAYRRYLCVVCGYVYDEEKGDPEHGLAPGTRYQDIPDDWACPDCGVTKAEFDLVREPVAGDGVSRSAVSPAASDDPRAVVILGAGMAGWAVAERLRARDTARGIVLVTRDAGDDYPKPWLSNAFARKQGHDDLIRIRGEDKARALGITLAAHTRVLALDVARRRVITAAGGIPYGDLVLATGARPLSLPVPGGELALAVNHLRDHRVLRERLSGMPGAPVAVVGAGLVGCELANDLALSGHPVHLLEREDRPLAHLLPAELSNRLREALATQGVFFHGRADVCRIEHLGADGYRVVTRSGETVTVGLVIRALGLAPDVGLARRAGIATGQGIRVDDRLRTSMPGIYALGDGMEMDGQLRPYVRALLEQAEVITARLCGGDARYRPSATVVNVKTTSLPLLVAPPGVASADSRWERVCCGPDGWEMHCRSGSGDLTGFALSGIRLSRGAALGRALASGPIPDIRESVVDAPRAALA